MQVVIFSKHLKQRDVPYVQQLFDVLYELQINAYVYAPYLEEIKQSITFKQDVGIFEGYLDFTVKKLDFFITLGGDGTILEAATFVRDSGTPILGINLGRLGFLASIEKTRIEETLRLLQAGRYQVESRSMLYLETNKPLFSDLPIALNDCTLLKRDTSSMITIHTYLNGAYLNSYWADGIIIATPTGSTGYSLSCGGPIIFPNSGNFVITPVAPHNLNVRPIVISDDSVLSFEIEGRAENFLCTLDSRSEIIDSSYKLALRRNDYPVQLVQIRDADFRQTIRNKLAWGMDARNH